LGGDELGSVKDDDVYTFGRVKNESLLGEKIATIR